MPLTLSELADDQAQDGGQPYLWTMNFGPQHPATHTTLRLVLKLDGERVADAIPDIGFLHSGFEKIGESLDFNQYVTVTDRMNYISPMSNNVAWHMAVEKLLGIEVTPRCSYIRTIVCELMRLSDHLLCLGAMGLDVGALTYFMYAFNARETIYDICEALCGARFTNSYTRVGGVMCDITPLVVNMIRDFLAEMPRVMDDMDRLLGRNRIFVDRMQGVGLLTKEEAINRSCTGPVARASGVVRDLRRDEPLPVLRRFRLPGLLCPRGRLPGAVPGPHGRDAGEPQDPPSGRGKHPPGAGQRRARPPFHPAAAGQGLDDDRGPDLALRAGDAQSRHARAQRGSLLLPPRRPTANWAFTSSATAARGPIAPAAGRLRSSILPCFRT